MVTPTLLVLAAGMGSRYGGMKQIEPVGPDGEAIMDYSIFDARRAGFGKVVFVIRKEIEQPFRQRSGHALKNASRWNTSFRNWESSRRGFLPSGRTKPWGTTHAILMASGVIHEPFAVINADDFYGEGGFIALARHLQSGAADCAMVGYVLRNTLSDFGAVARGVCQVGDDGYLKEIVELKSIERDGGTLSGHGFSRTGDPADRRRGGLNEHVGIHTPGFRATPRPLSEVPPAKRLRFEGGVLHPHHSQ